MTDLLSSGPLANIAGAAVQAGLLALVVWGVVAAAGRRLPAAWRCGLWLLVLGRLAVPIAGPIAVPVLAADAASEKAPAPRQTRRAAVSLPAAPAPAPPPEAVRPPVETPAFPESEGHAASSAPVAVDPSVAGTPSAEPGPHPWRKLLFGLWAAGAALGGLRAGVRRFRLRRSLRGWPDVADPAALATLRRAAEASGVTRTVRFVESPPGVGPAVCGAIRPAVLLPPEALADPSALRAAALHEFAHLRRRDVAVGRLVGLVRVLWWPHPAAHLAASRWRTEREIACDALALDRLTPAERLDYGRLVVGLLCRPRPGRPALPASLFDRFPPLRKRVEAMTRHTPPTARSRVYGGALTIALAAASLVTVTAAAPPDVPPPSASLAASEVPDEQTAEPSVAEGSAETGADQGGEAGPWAISGRVVDDQGRPVAGARLWWVISRGRPDVTVVGETDERGRFTLTPPELGPVRRTRISDTLWVLKDGHGLATARARGFTPPADRKEELIVLLGPEAATSFVVAAPAGTPLPGVQLEPTGKPLPGVQVEPWHLRTFMGYDIVPEQVRTLLSVTTDAAGPVRMPHAPPEGFHDVRAISEKYGIQIARLDTERNPPTERLITLRSAGRLEGRLVGNEPESVRGVRLWFDTRAEGRFVGGTYFLYPEGHATAMTDDAGRFVVPAIAEGALRIGVETAPDAAAFPRLPESVTLRGGATETLEISLEPSIPVHGEIRTRDTNEPVPGAEIHIGYGLGRQGETVQSDAEGRYETRVLPGPVYTQVIVRPKEFWDYEQVGSPFREKVEVPGGVASFELPPIRLVPTAPLEGRLVDLDGRPIPGVRLNGLKENRRYGFATTDEAGKFAIRVPEGVEFDRYEIYFEEHTKATPTIVETDPLVLRVAKPND